ncbi:hypothetical protein [Streptomyces sp. NPDC029554]|uniref:hypothetical protein n=1 Tax=Streptomyces sp. NPDC029554 TaxID=3155126 RepID=UPI0033CFF50D
MSSFGQSRMMAQRAQSPLRMDADMTQRIGVIIPENGPAVIDGEPLTAGPGETRDAVLAYLHDRAAAQGSAVEAVVLDSATWRPFILSVTPDGASRITSDRPSSAPPQSSPEPAATPDADGEENAPPSGRPTRPAPALGRHDAVGAPDPMHSRVRGIVEMLKRGQVDGAYQDSRLLRERLESEGGPSHPYAVEARALEAYAAYLTGDYRTAMSLALGVSRIRCGQQDPRAVEDATRAVAIWQKLSEKQAVIVHGLELKNMWARLHEKNQLSHWHLELMDYIDWRLDTVRTEHSLGAG